MTIANEKIANDVNNYKITITRYITHPNTRFPISEEFYIKVRLIT